MSFSDRLEKTRADKLELGTNRCALASLYTDERLTKEDQTKLIEVVDAPVSDPKRYSNSNIALALREEGIEISRTAIGDHRRKLCRCYSKVNK